MHTSIYLLIGQHICFCFLFIFSKGKSLVGENVREAFDGDFPYTVSLSYTDENNTAMTRHFCTGTLVSNRDVLSSIHCLANLNRTLVVVIVGSIDTRRGQKHSVSWWLSYDQWTDMNNITRMFKLNDLVMIRLATNASNLIVPAELTDIRNRKLVGYTVTMAGWGLREDNRIPPIMHTGDLTVIDLDECKARVSKLLGRRYFIDSNMFCTVATPYILGRKGDSGGPVLLFNQIVGVSVSTCPFPGVPVHPEKVNLHAGVFNYRNFIYDVIQNCP